MDGIQKSAHTRNGDFMFDLTWRARKGSNKWLWGAVFILALVRLLGRSVIFGAFAYGVTFLSEKFIFGREMFFPLWTVLLFFALASPFAESRMGQAPIFGYISNFISIAGDMSRMMHSKADGFGRMIAKLMYALSGSLAVYCAIAAWVINESRLHILTTGELDVLGNALSSGGFWNAATKIYHVLYSKHNTTPVHPRDKSMQTAVSYAFACKWMMRKPGLTDGDKNNFKAIIEDVMEKYALADNDRMRLQEALG